MTRINIIEPSELTDQHLIAEYREITMVPGSLKRTLASKSGYQESKVSKRFTLKNSYVSNLKLRGFPYQKTLEQQEIELSSLDS